MCTSCMTTQVVDPSAGDAFVERLAGIMNDSALALMISIGHRTNLFDTMAGMAPATSHELAEAAGLNERYVREWLGAMTTGRIVRHDAEAGTYRLPDEHAAALTRAASPNNMAAFMQFFAVLGAVETQVVDAFRHGNGVPYEAYDRFNEVMAEESGQTVVAGLNEHILPLVPGLTERMTEGIDVLDVGCGCGRALIDMAERYPRSRFVGYDLLESAIGVGRAEAQRRGLTNIRFEVQDASTFEDNEAYDLICTFDAVHDQGRPDRVLANIHRALRPEGVYLMQDIAATSSHAGDMDLPMAPFIYTISCTHCMSVSLAQGGMGLGAAWGRQLALSMLADAGFTRTRVEQLEHDTMNDYFINQK